MKEEVTRCLNEVVKEKFGQDKWEDALEKAGLDRHIQFIEKSNIRDKDIINVVNSICKILNISIFQLADTFEDYWINNFLPNNF